MTNTTRLSCLATLLVLASLALVAGRHIVRGTDG